VTLNVYIAGGAIRMCNPPVTPPYVAKMSTSPALTPVTEPEPLTLATDVFDEVQVTWEPTDRALPSEDKAIAVNCDVMPTVGAAPATWTDDTVVG
jgi:hypothetical protein